jgi:hypothetical protein
LTRHAPDLANRIGLTLDVVEEDGVVTALQPLLDEGPENDLKAHRELERGRRLPGNDSGPIQVGLGENEEDLGLIREHHASVSCRLARDPFDAGAPLGI